MAERRVARKASAHVGVRVTRLPYGVDQLLVLSAPARGGHRPESLSEAEWQVAVLAASGRSNRMIASERGTSVRTVANQLASTFRKLRVVSRTELALLLGGGGSAPDAAE